MTNESDPIAAVADARCLALTTFKRDGTAVTTPIWFNVLGGTLVVTTPRTAWKVKRVANNPRVTFATCTQRGKVTGPVFGGRARVLPDAELGPVMAAKRRRYRSARFIQLLPGNSDQVAIGITPDA